MTEEELKQKDSDIENFIDHFDKLKNEVAKNIIGQEEVIEFTLIAIIAGGHVLLEGAPGLGKTLLVKTIAEVLSLSFKRVQFTPDLMPADIIGTQVFLEDASGHSRFEFSPGPVFCNLLLGDEINRATPKTQSALLEAMQERAVTVFGETRQLDLPHFVLATQNSIEQEGTYPLPEAQLDRFFFKLLIDYPTFQEFENILELTTSKSETKINKLFNGADLISMGDLAREVPIPPTIKKRAVELVMGTHPETEYSTEEVKRYVRYGASPRAGQALLIAAKIKALLNKRFYVATEDILSVALQVLNHRIILNFEAQADGVSVHHLLENLMNEKKSKWVKC